MKKTFRTIIAALITAATISSAGTVSLSAHATQPEAADQAMSQAVLPDEAEAPAAASAADPADPLPFGYKDQIHTLEDYILAVRRTGRTNEEIRQAIDAANNYVPYVDNSKNKYFPKIGNQNPLGTCVAWSTIYYQFTNQVNKMLDRAATNDTTMQEMFLYNIYDGCGLPRHIENLLHSMGCAPVSMVPDHYNTTTWSTQYDIWREAANYRAIDYISFQTIGEKGVEISSVDDPDLAAIKAALRNGDVLSYAGPIDEFVWDKIVEAPGVDKDIVGEWIATKSLGGGVPNHMMTIVGYNDNIWVDHNQNGKVDPGEKGALKIANSWGNGWRNKGFYWIAYDALNARSTVQGVVSESNRTICVYGPVNFILTKNYGASGIFLKCKINSDNRADSYVEMIAKRKSDGKTFTRKLNPYFYADYSNKSRHKMNYEGGSGYCNGEFVTDLNTMIANLDSDNFHDYTWSFRFVDVGKDSSSSAFKEAYIVDENTNVTYHLNTAFPLNLNKQEKTVALKDYYHFSKLIVPAASTLTVGSSLKFTFKTANEHFGDTPVKYTMTITQNGKQVFSKQHKATSVDKAKASSVIKGTWKPTKTGTYQITVTATDASGAKASRSAEFRVYNKGLAVRSINIDKGKYIDTFETVRITPQVTGGTAPYTYSYYYVKGGKTYKIAENVKSSTKTKKFGSNSGVYQILVKVKDASGKVAQATQNVVVQPVKVGKFFFCSDVNGTYLKDAHVGNTIYLYSEVNYCPDFIKNTEYEYTVEKGGRIETLKYVSGNKVAWTPSEGGTYHVTCKVTYNGKVLGTRTVDFVVPGEAASDLRQINVNVITYVVNETNSAEYRVHYWGGKTTSDAQCKALNTTKSKNVGFWNTAQTFKQFVCYIPADATGYKFHAGNRWFPDGVDTGDGSTATYNTVYVFHYGSDRAIYTKE